MIVFGFDRKIKSNIAIPNLIGGYMQEYSGPLHKPSIKSTKVRAATVVFYNQTDRCSNPNNLSFKNYGAKGIRVEYTARQFVTWFLKNYPQKNYVKKKWHVGRKDHSKNYSFENIEFQTIRENCLERWHRVGPMTPMKPIKATLLTSNEILEFESIEETHRVTGICINAIKRSARRKKPVLGYLFEWKIDAL